jgi:PHD/YefM family antitoxin component YafN of YafNO toxin-antitoxin module
VVDISIQDLEDRFDEVIDDVANNKTTYLVKTDKGSVVLMPAEQYDTLTLIYEEWLNETGLVDY